MIKILECFVALCFVVSALAIGATGLVTFLVWVAGWSRLRCDRRDDSLRSPLQEG